MNATLNEFLTGVIDYAGLFPPASLDMDAAVRNFAAYSKSEYAGWLGRFVVPVSRLAEFENAAIETPEAWRLSVLVGADLASDLESIRQFNQRHGDRAKPPIDSIEIKAVTPEEIRANADFIPSGLAAYFEIPIHSDPQPLISALSESGARAKVRTGGVTAEAFPSGAELAEFLARCAECDLPFKATAGLHHPIRSIHPLTYEPESASALMHGFLNLFLAATFAQNGMSVRLIEQLIEERSPAAFSFESGAVIWRGHQVVRAHLRNTRSLFALSFGSCSFDEPVEDLKRIGLL